MSEIAIITDSSSYIAADLLEKHHIYIVDNPVIFGETVYHESRWPVNPDFYREMASSAVQPTTSQPATGDIEAVFDQVKADGYKQAIMVTLSSGFSGTYEAAVSTAKQYQDLDVHVWDSKIACIGAGNQALLAADLAEKGYPVDEILKRLLLLRQRTGVLFVVDSIKHLQRTGRLSGGQALVAGLLSIKPILQIDTNQQGKIDAIAKARKMTGAWEYIEAAFGKTVAIYKKNGWPLRVMVIDADNPELADSWTDRAKVLWPEIVFEGGIIGPLIGVHTGGKAVGYLWAQDYKTMED